MSQDSRLGTFLTQLSFPVVMLIGAASTGYYYYNSYDDGTELEKRIANIMQSENIELTKKKETEKILAEQEALKQEIGMLADKFREISSKLPLSLRNQEIIDTINLLAKNAGCRVISIKPESTRSRELYDEIPIKIEMKGQFSNLVVFMYYLSTLERITNTEDFHFSNENSYFNGTLKYETTVVSFRYKPPTERTEENIKNVKPPKDKAYLDEDITELKKERT